MSISFTVTAYNESQRGDGEWITRCLAAAAKHPLVAEIVVVDDASEDWGWLQKRLRRVPKLKLFHNEVNHGTFGNKLEALARATCDWAVMCDSDNVIEKGYFDRLQQLVGWRKRMWYCADFGKPELDYQALRGRHDLDQFVRLAEDEAFACLFNTGNQFVPRKQTLRLFRKHRGPNSHLPQRDYFGNGPDRRITDAAECAFINSRWLMAGGRLHVVRGLEYEHRCDLATSAFMDAPELKRALPPVYLLEMEDHIAGRDQEYHIDTEPQVLDGHTCFVYRPQKSNPKNIGIAIDPFRLTSRRAVE